MTKYFIQNLNYNGNGAVIASPDGAVPLGGSYRYHWSRDGALSMRAWFETMRYTSGAVAMIKQYIVFLDAAHNQTDPNGINVLVEPKFELNGQVFTGGWCRPQNDGPGVRATTLIIFANFLAQQGQLQFVQQYLWTGNDNIKQGGIIKRDLDWIAQGGWSTNTCDLWEEVQSTGRR